MDVSYASEIFLLGKIGLEPGAKNIPETLNLLSLNNPLLEGIIAGKSFYLGKIEIKTAQKILN